MRRVRAVSALLLILALTTPALADKAHSAYKAGIEAETRDRTDAAYEAYERAYQLKPRDPRYLAAYTRLRFRAAAEHVHKGELLLEAGNLSLALAEFVRAAEIDTSSAMAKQEVRRTREMIKAAAAQGQVVSPEDPLADLADRAEGPVQLQPVANTPITLRMTENTKAIYKTIGSLVGINVIFDPEYTPRKITIELNGVALNDALEIVALASKTFWRPVTANTIYVAAESAAKHKEVEQSVMKTFYLSNVSTPADLTEAANALRSILDVTRVLPIQAQNALLVRATPDQLVLAQKLLSDIDKAKGEVMIDVAILEVTRDRLRTLGTTPPTTASASIGKTPLTLQGLGNLNSADFLVSIPGASFTALMSDSNTKIIQNPQMRVLDNQKATMKIGDRVPVATGSFSPGVGGGGINALVNTQFQYLDVGVNIDITPRIHSRQDVTLKIAVEVSSVTGTQNIGGVTQPVIGQRRIEHETRLREGEVNLLGGILEDSVSDAFSGYPWLSKIPLLRYLFGQNNTNHTEREIVFAITPHIMRAQDVTARNLRAIDVGTPGTVELRFSNPPKPATRPATPAPSAPQQPAPGQPPQPSSTQSGKVGATQPRPAPEAGAPPGAKLPASAIQNHAATPAAPAAVSAGNTTLSFEPTTISQPVGGTFKVYVSISGAQNVFSIPLQINYDPQLLQVVDVANGGFLNQDRQPVALVYRADTAKGTLQITGTRPPNSGGVSGSGTVFVVTLSAKSVGESVMDIAGASVLDPGMQAASATGGDLLVTVTSNEPPKNEERNNPSTPPSVSDQDKHQSAAPVDNSSAQPAVGMKPARSTAAKPAAGNRGAVPR
ncbi:MAG: type II and III secretion system protein [Acidobacteriia bacterium]|nr:type II and III secretion system protein [Terriglobia bacterium]